MNIQMPFSGFLFPELGSQPSLSKLSGSAPVRHFDFKIKLISKIATMTSVSIRLLSNDPRIKCLLITAGCMPAQ